MLRHTFAHHRRETIAFGRRHNAVLERAGLFVVWRNLVKKRTQRRPERRTAAMLVGLTTEPWDWERVFAKRLFPRRVPLSETWERVYRREIRTRGLAINAAHNLKNAC